MYVLFVALLCALLPLSRAQTLPAYSGTYGVGLVDIEVPVQHPRNVTNTTFTSNGQSASFLQTVLFSLYYPIDASLNSTSPAHPWIGGPIDCIAAGIALYANSSAITKDVVASYFNSVAGNLTIPAQADTPLVNSSTPVPILVFSVGDITLRTWLSQFAGLLATNGIATAVIEHRDGTLACTIVEEKGQPNRTVQFIEANQLSAPVSGNQSELVLEQRDFRQAEVEEVVTVLKNLNAGHGDLVYANNSRNEGTHFSSFANRLDFSNLVMGGHSFGATLVFQALGDNAIPAKAGLAFDPGKQSGPLNTDFDQSVLIADSEAWSSQPSEFYGQQHFDVVKELAEGALNKTGASWFMTLLGTSHSSITDAPLLVGASLLSFFDPTATNITLGNPESNIKQYANVAVELFDYLKNKTRSGILAHEVTADEFEAIKANDTTATGAFDGWEIHVAPTAGANVSSTPTSISTTATSSPSSSSTPSSGVLSSSLSKTALLMTLLLIVSYCI